MSYVEWWWFIFCLHLNSDRYKPHATALCKLVMPCLPEWQENFQHAPVNDNSRV